jgi:uncharacterized protein YjdB
MNFKISKKIIFFLRIQVIFLFFLPPIISGCNSPETANMNPKIFASSKETNLQKDARVKDVVINISNLSLDVNKTITLISQVDLENNDVSNAIQWVSSDNSVVSVNSSGKLNALKKGAAVIRAVSIQDPAKYAECLVTVKDSEESVPVKIEIENTYENENIPENTSVQLKGTVKYLNGNYDNNIKWASSDETIAKVDNQGLITGLRPGKVTISAFSSYDISVSSFIILYIYRDKDQNPVNPEDLSPVYSVSIEKPSATNLKAGENINLTAKITLLNGNTITNNDVSWSSSDSTVATVNSSGFVTTLKEGAVTITATSYRDKSKEDSILITVVVSPGIITVSSVNIVGVNHNLRVGNSLTMNATVTMSDNSANSDISWSSSDTNIATIDNTGIVTALKEGTVTITAKSNRNITKKDTFVFNIRNFFTWYVNDDATGDNSGLTWANSFNRLDLALSSSQFGDQIWVASGTYQPALDESFILKSGISIYGGFGGTESNINGRTAPGSVILKGNSKKVLKAINTNNITLDGLVVQNGKGPAADGDGGGLYIKNSTNISLKDMIFRQNFAFGNAGGLLIIASSDIFLKNVNFADNFSNEGGGAVGIRDSTNVSITDSQMSGNTSDNGQGIIWNSGSSPTLTNITITGNHNKGHSCIVNVFDSNPIITNIVESGND